MADFDIKPRSCENDKVKISAYERIKVIFFMTETFHLMELTGHPVPIIQLGSPVPQAY